MSEKTAPGPHIGLESALEAPHSPSAHQKGGTQGSSAVGLRINVEP